MIFKIIRSRKKTAADTQRVPELEPVIEEGVLRYVKDLPLPDPNGRLGTKLVVSDDKSACYLLIFVGEGDLKYVNAGYAAAQIATYLRYKRIPSVICKELPEQAHAENFEDLECAAALQLFAGHGTREWSGRKKVKNELPCICKDMGEDWADAVLAYVKTRYPNHFGSVHTIRDEHGLHFWIRNMNGRKNTAAGIDAGIAIARVMIVAEQLWIELELDREDVTKLLKKRSQRYLVSISRKNRANLVPALQ